jgi:polyhydroxyalkanoate synthesis repressor PhaR
MDAERVIKKYANRRLYDSTASRHVTLEDLRGLIVEGHRIKVVDDKTGEDITRSILLLIIADQEVAGRPLLSTKVLESLIRFYGNSMQEFMSRYLEQSVANFVEQQQTAQAQIAKLMSGTPFASMSDLARQNLETWNRFQDSMIKAMTSAVPGVPPPRPAPGPGPGPEKTEPPAPDSASRK